VEYVKDFESGNDKLILEHRFHAIDADGNGVLDAKEIQKFQELCGNRITLEEAEEMVKQMDMDNDGRLTLEDFIRAKTA
jgi:Ca2+-binding EF-hand superfamily protein